MPTDIRLILTDMDGTLLSPDRTVSIANRNAVSDARLAGIETTLATGRLDLLVESYVRSLSIVLPVISCNGALIRDLSAQNQTPIYMNPLSPSVAENVLRWCRNRSYDCLAYTAKRVWYPETSRRIGFFHEYNRQARTAGHIAVPLHAYRASDMASIASEGVLKLFLSRRDEQDIEVVEAALKQELSGFTTTHSVPDTVDIIAEGSSKGDALLRLAAYVGLSPAQVAVFGDNQNDVSMFEVAGLSFAMANAGADVRRCAGQVTESNENDGFARAVYTHIINISKEIGV